MKLTIGAPHIRSKIKQARNNNYTLEIANNELLDFPILKCSKIIETISIDDGKLYKLCISDNYINGFENILSEGLNNPLNFGHERNGQDSDSEISEFGTGMKQSLAAIGKKITIFTKLKNNKYYKIVLDFPKMCEVENVIDSYNPTSFIECNEKEYLEYHPFKNGSTIIIEEIHNIICNITTSDDITDLIIKNIQYTYSKLIKKNNIKIEINNKIVKPKIDYFENKSAKPFIEKRFLYIKKINDINNIIIEETVQTNENRKNKTEYRIYNKMTKKYNKINKKDFNEYLKYDNYYNKSITNEKDVTIEIKATALQFIKNLDEIPKCKFGIFKIDRHHGDYHISSTNGIKNYVYGEIIFKSKKLGKDIGANYNKTINLKSKNDICDSILECIKNISTILEYDTATKKSEYFYQKAIDLGLHISDDKIPTKFENKTKINNKLNTNLHADKVDKVETVETVETVDKVDKVEPVDNKSNTKLIQNKDKVDNNSVKDNEYGNYNISEYDVGKSTHVKISKTAVNKIFNEINIYINNLQDTNKIIFQNEICEKILEMIMKNYSKTDRCYIPLKNMAKNCGFNYMKNEYNKLIDDKSDEDYVIGGSILHTYWSKKKKD